VALKRLLDFLLALLLLVPALLVMGILAVLIRLDSPGPVIFAQRRTGRDNRLFTMYKLRTMRVGTPQLATHLIDHTQYRTRIGGFLRKSSLDELPNILNILKGEMSFVGPRPALYNQDDLIAMRTMAGVHRFPPGLTGWAQINGRDELANEEKVALDRWYCEHWSLALDLRIILRTAAAVVKAAGVHG